jgi:hypothetical protein
VAPLNALPGQSCGACACPGRPFGIWQRCKRGARLRDGFRRCSSCGANPGAWAVCRLQDHVSEASQSTMTPRTCFALRSQLRASSNTAGCVSARIQAGLKSMIEIIIHKYRSPTNYISNYIILKEAKLCLKIKNLYLYLNCISQIYPDVLFTFLATMTLKRSNRTSFIVLRSC